MKRCSALIAILAMALSLAGCGQIGSEKAISVALADQGIDRIGAASTKAILDKTADPVTYKVILDLNTHYENYIINAKTGEIISHETQVK
jgi:hypothetical protein